MLKFYVKASDLLDRLRTDKDGVVSFEYIIVAALVIAAVGCRVRHYWCCQYRNRARNGITDSLDQFH